MKTGVIGLGAMGANMARRLASAGHLQTVFNRAREKAERPGRRVPLRALKLAGRPG